MANPRIIETDKKLKDSAVQIKDSAAQMERSTARVEDSADRRTELAADRTCVYRKPRPGRSGDEARQGSGVI
jgi:hypothetical protein